MTSRLLGKLMKANRYQHGWPSRGGAKNCDKHPAVILKSCGKKYTRTTWMKIVGGQVKVNSGFHREYCPKCFPEGCPTCSDKYWLSAWPNTYTRVNEEPMESRSGDRIKNKRITGRLNKRKKGHEKGRQSDDSTVSAEADGAREDA
jgi:hypothetical protein